MEKIEISNELFEKIKDLYLNKKFSLREIAKDINRSVSFVSRILQENGLYSFINLNQSIVNDLPNRFQKEANFIFVAKCKQTGKQYEDYENKSGVLIRYITELYPDLIIPSKFKRKSYYHKNGKFWHEQYFDIIKIEYNNKLTKQCKYCNWLTVDLDNKSGMYTTHIKEQHNKDIQQYLIDFPEESEFFKTFLEKKAAKIFINEKEENRVECQLCGQRMQQITHSHLKKNHNITRREYKNKFGRMTSDVIHLKLSEHAKLTNQTMFPKKENTNIELAIINLLDRIEIGDYETQKRVGNFYYDFFFKDCELFLEADGFYWHGHDRVSHWDVNVFKNIINDYRKSEKVTKIIRLIESVSINTNNLNQINTKDSFFNFLIKENFDIKKHKMFNLKEDDIIFSKKFCENKQDYFIEKKLPNDLEFMMKNFYSPKEYKKFINYSARYSQESLLKGIFFEPFYKAHKIDNKNIYSIFSAGNNLKKTIEYRLGINKSKEYFDVNIKNIYRGIEVRTLFNVGIFPVKYAKDIYNEFVKENDFIYDPFSGWASRAMAMENLIKENGCAYIGNDINQELKGGYEYIINRYFYEHKNQISLNTEDSKVFCSGLKNKIDFIFTSPPFYNDEIYRDEQNIYRGQEEWKVDLLLPVFKNCYEYLKNNSYVVIDMKELYKETTKDALIESGFKFIEERSYGVSKSHYANKTKKQYLLIFKKD